MDVRVTLSLLDTDDCMVSTPTLDGPFAAADPIVLPVSALEGECALDETQIAAVEIRFEGEAELPVRVGPPSIIEREALVPRTPRRVCVAPDDEAALSLAGRLRASTDNQGLLPSDQEGFYDTELQALLALAFDAERRSSPGEAQIEAAEAVVLGIARMQLPSGAWAASYLRDGDDWVPVEDHDDLDATVLALLALSLATEPDAVVPHVETATAYLRAIGSDYADGGQRGGLTDATPPNLVAWHALHRLGDRDEANRVAGFIEAELTDESWLAAGRDDPRLDVAALTWLGGAFLRQRGNEGAEVGCVLADRVLGLGAGVTRTRHDRIGVDVAATAMTVLAGCPGASARQAWLLDRLDAATFVHELVWTHLALRGTDLTPTEE